MGALGSAGVVSGCKAEKISVRKEKKKKNQSIAALYSVDDGHDGSETSPYITCDS